MCYLSQSNPLSLSPRRGDEGATGLPHVISAPSISEPHIYVTEHVWSSEKSARRRRKCACVIGALSDVIVSGYLVIVCYLKGEEEGLDGADNCRIYYLFTSPLPINNIIKKGSVAFFVCGGSHVAWSNKI